MAHVSLKRAVAIIAAFIFATMVSNVVDRYLRMPHPPSNRVPQWVLGLNQEVVHISIDVITIAAIFFSKKESPWPYAMAYTLPLMAFYDACTGFFWIVPWSVFVIVPLIELVCGPDETNPTADEARILNSNPQFKWITWMWVPVQLVYLLWSCWAAANWTLTLGQWAGLVVTSGLCTGILGINIAHEMIHKSDPFEQLLGKILLVTVGYGHFFVEHLQGHHRYVSTDVDPVTSHYGENFYQFWPRSVVGSFKSAWHIEVMRLQKAGGASVNVWTKDNQMLQFVAATAACALGSFVLFGGLGLIHFIGQAICAFSMLEIVNYIEHYGLQRRKLSITTPAFATGMATREKLSYEPVTPLHSWNADTRITNLFLFKLQRHSDHHAYASRRYQILRSFAAAPQMPTGYAGMLCMALLPPLWFRIMNPLVDKFRSEESVRYDALAREAALLKSPLKGVGVGVGGSSTAAADAKLAAAAAAAAAEDATSDWRATALQDEDLDGASDSLIAKAKQL